MRFFLKRVAILLGLLVVLPQIKVSAHSLAPPKISAEAAVVYSMETKEFVYEKSADKVLSMASTTKIMTALLAFEYCEDLGDILVEINAEEAATEGSSMGLEAGDKIYLSQLTAGMLIASGNDAANAVARVISDDFPKAMNSRAEKIGMSSTNFVTPSGLDDDRHYSTARDMALLTAEALNNRTFADIVSRKTVTVSYNDGSKTQTFENHNRLLWYMDNCIGVKTGYTKKSGRCLVSAVKDGGNTLICVTLNGPDDWNDHMALYEYARVRQVEYTYKNTEFILPTTDTPVVCRLENSEKICYFSSARIEERVYLPKFIYSSSYNKGDIIGKTEYISGGKIIAVRNIIID